MAKAPVLGRQAAGRPRRHGLRRALQRPARPRVRPRGAQRAPPGHRVDEDARPGPRRRRQAVAPEGHRPRPRRLDALADLDRRRRRLRPARRATTPSRSTARSAARRCAARCRSTPSAARSPCSTRRASTRRRPSRRRRCSPTGPRGGSVLVVLADEQARVALSFRNLERVSVLPATGVGVADLIGAASVLVTREALDQLTRARSAGGRRRRRRPDMEPSQVHHPPGRQREELRARRQRQVHVPRPPRRAQDADPPGRRGALRRQGRRGPHDVASSPSPSAAGSPPGARAPGRRPIVQVRAGRLHPDLPGPAGPGGLTGTPWPSASPSPPAPAGASRPTRTSPRSRRPSPRRALVEGLRKSGGRNAHGRKTVAPPRRRRQAPVPQDRLQAPQGRRSRRRSPRSSTTPTARPTSRCCTTPTARSATSSRRAGCASARRCSPGPGAEISVGNCLPLANMPIGTVVHNVELAARARRPDGPLGGRRRSSSWPRTATWRRCACPRARCAWCAPSAAPPSARSATPTTRTSRSARPAASATWACARRRAARP